VAAEQPWSNPVDYQIWGNMSARQKRAECEHLRQRLIDVLAGLEQSVIGDGSDAYVSISAFEPQQDIFTIHCDISQNVINFNKLN